MKSLRLILSHPRYFAPAFVFASINILLGTWVIYIPQVKSKLDIDDGQLGLALFFYALGVMIMLPLVPMLTKRLGVGRATIYGLVLFAIAFTLPLMASTYWMLCAALLVTGAFSGGTDVAMNALVSHLEKSDQVSFMSSAHGFFSLGGVFGAGFGGLIMHLFQIPAWHMMAVGFMVVMINLILARHYLSIRIQETTAKREPFSLLKLSPLFGIAFIAFVVMGSEGAIEHWSKLYLLDVISVNDQLAGYGFVIFSMTMTAGRFFGDGISDRIGSYRVITYGIVLASVGFALVLLKLYLLVLLGFGLIGLGLSVVIPELFRIAGHTRNIPTALSISFVSGLGFVGFLLGPVVLGYISNISDLSMSFLALFLLSILAFILSMVISRKE